MNKKLNTIKLMREKLLNIQNHLEKLANQEVQVEEKLIPISMKVKSNNPCNTYKNKYFKNPTFWGNNPILAKQNERQYRAYSSNKYSQTNILKNRNHFSPSPKVKELSKIVSLWYYCPKKDREQINDIHSLQKEKNQKEKKYYTPNKQQSSPDNRGQTPRFKKIKTYAKQVTDPILNPSLEKIQGKKIVRKIQKSPQNPYTQNPQSQPLLYFNNTQPIYLSPQRNLTNARNDSLNVLDVLTTSTSHKSIQEQKSIKKSSKGKKHFTQYFEDTHGCRWA